MAAGKFFTPKIQKPGTYLLNTDTIIVSDTKSQRTPTWLDSQI